eukprot:TRINITY_DN14332_c0_g1_i1.p1 TRINITY_DN14332_c0_g1~~TRINITY_DN14332_c0_g1_i1.p1  ORF type:complete len:490 (+),score=99.10 TRINITY_DN14332_c0_g1_i1:172-1641(+)
MLGARGNTDALQKLKDKYDTEDADRNCKAVSDREGRLLQLQLKVLAYRPDVLVVEELDHYRSLSNELQKAGYSSFVGTDSKTYTPAHIDGFSDKDEASASAFCEKWASRGHAFLPHLASTCMQITLKNNGIEPKLRELAKIKGLKEKLFDSDDKLLKNWASVAAGESRDFLKSCGCDPDGIDDMGVAVFWDTDRFSAETLKIKTYKKGGGGAVVVTLKDKSTDELVTVLGTHLGSGDSAADEAKRLSDQVEGEIGLKSWVEEASRDCSNVILCLDANSHPQIEAEGGKSCWRTLHTAPIASVWNRWFDAEGKVKQDVAAEALHPPVTSNKVRGPSSGQAKKIGLHSYYLIDHVYYGRGLRLDKHAYEPKRFESESVALAEVQPSLDNPTDHYPVVVDLFYATHRPPVTINSRQATASQAELIEERVKPGAMPLDDDGRFTLVGNGDAASRVADVAALLQERTFATIDNIQTAYERGVASLRIGMKLSVR